MIDPFETLGIEPKFDIDLRAVEQRHRDLSKALHPDRYAGAPAAERRMSLSRAIDVNAAWRAVRDPVQRAEALLRRAKVDVTETSAPKADPELLMEMMEAREELSDAARSKDTARIERLGRAMRAREETTIGALGRKIAEAGDPDALQRVLPLLGELRYIRRFLDEVNAIEEELAP
jgi:molecular chaperone HscB